MAKPKVKKSFKDRMVTTLSTINTPTFRLGFSKIDLWVGASNFAMNRLWSGRFDRALLFGRQYIFYGESGSGKSYISAIIAANAQREHGALVVWLDVEHATDDEAGQQWLQRAGIDMENLIYSSVATLEEIKKVISKICVDYRKSIDEGDEELQPIVFVVDSWAAAITESQWERTGGKKAGELVGDQGQKAKQTGDVISSINHLVAGTPIMVIGIQHIMDNQDGWGRKHKTTGGNKMIFLASGAMMLTKKELKDEETENEEVVEHYKTLSANMTADARKKMGKNRFVGINATMEILKSRVSKPFEKVEIQIPYLTGLDPYSGLFDLLQQENLVTNPSQGWYQYIENGKEVKFQKKSFREHADRIMAAAPVDISAPSEVPVEDVVPEEVEVNDAPDTELETTE